MPKIDLTSFLAAKSSVGDLLAFKSADFSWAQAPTGQAVPSVSGAWVIYVASDIDLVSGTWTSRTVNGAPPLTMDAYGSPAIITDMPWAAGVPVLSCESGCFFVDRAPFPADWGFSLAMCHGGEQNRWAQFYNGPVIHSNTPEALRFFRNGTTRFVMATKNGYVGNSSASYSDGSFPDGTTLQVDKPAGNVTIAEMSLWQDGASQTLNLGSSDISSAGERFIIGGMSVDATNITLANTARVLMAALKIDGTPASAADRTAIVDFANGLKSGALI